MSRSTRSIAPLALTPASTLALTLALTLPLTLAAGATAQSPSNPTLWVANGQDDTLTAIDTTSLTVTHTYPVGAKARGLATAGTGNDATAYVTNKADGTLSIIHLARGTVTTVPVGTGAHGIRISPDGATLYVALAGKNAVAELDAATGTTLRTIQVGPKPEQLDLTHDGNTLAVSNTGNNTVTLIDANQQRVLRTVPSGRGNFGVQFAQPHLPANP